MEHKIIRDDGKPTANNQKKNVRGYIQATKKDWVGTAPLKNNNILFSTLKSKAEIWNKQYRSEFIQDNPLNMPYPIEHPSPSMPEIKVSRDLNPHQHNTSQF